MSERRYAFDLTENELIVLYLALCMAREELGGTTHTRNDDLPISQANAKTVKHLIKRALACKPDGILN